MRIAILQNFIDILRRKIYYLPFLVEKFKCLQRQNNVRTLILGSSHLEMGYKPDVDKQELNMATMSQDLYYSYNLYKLCNEMHGDIENIVISYSVFTQGHSLVWTNLSSLCVMFKSIFGIDYQYPEVARNKKCFWLEPFYNWEVKQLLKKDKSIKKSRIDESAPTRFNVKQIETIALNHFKNHQRPVSQVHYLVKILEEANARNQKVIIVLPPVTNVYKNALLDKELFNKLYESVKEFQNIKILDYYHSDYFNDNDFCDGDHVNSEGAKKLTSLIRSFL